jgi:hypothetical protein
MVERQRAFLFAILLGATAAVAACTAPSFEGTPIVGDESAALPAAKTPARRAKPSEDDAAAKAAPAETVGDDAGATTTVGSTTTPPATTTCLPRVAAAGDGHHHAGDDCGGCHGEWTAAGTLLDRSGQALAGATIELVDARGVTTKLVTHTNGNFFTTKVFAKPLTVRATGCPVDARMSAAVTDASCNTAGCHVGGIRLR